MNNRLLSLLIQSPEKPDYYWHPSNILLRALNSKHLAIRLPLSIGVAATNLGILASKAACKPVVGFFGAVCSEANKTLSKGTTRQWVKGELYYMDDGSYQRFDGKDFIPE